MMTLSEIRSTLKMLGMSPAKSMGQNFLFDPNMARWIVSQLGSVSGKFVLEVGPGLGVLTEPLLEFGAQVLALEKDRRLADRLPVYLQSDRLQVQWKDATEFDPRTLFLQGPVSFIGNLPYYVTSSILFQFLTEQSPVEQAVIMVQKELGLRLSAQPSTANYGGITLILGRRWHIEYLKTVPPDVFYPAPKVDSAVIRFRKRDPKELPSCDGKLFDRLVKLGFSQRRKQLQKLLKTEVANLPEILAQLGLDLRVRAEEMSLAIWIDFTRLVSHTGLPELQDIDTEMLDVVDENNAITGQDNRRSIHVNKLRHRSVHVLVFNRHKELLLQKRSHCKTHYPGLWDTSAAGHVDAGELYEAAATRELREELGIDATPNEIGTIPASETNGWEFTHVYEVYHNSHFRIAPDEIECVQFFPVSLIREWIQKRPQDFAPGFDQVLITWQNAEKCSAGNLSCIRKNPQA